MADDIPEHEAARLWRESKGWSRRELAEKIGFSESMIQDYEAGHIRGSGAKIGKNEWKRYRNACAAVDADSAFSWGQK
jgi:predicted transcriptional regulator